MSFPRYPNYKASGVEWLGEVPEHWPVKRIGYYFSERREKVSDKDFPALSVTKNGIVPQLDTAAKSDDGDNRKKVLKGDFVINSRSDRKGSAGASELDGSVSLICTVMRPQEHVHTPFVHHLLRCQPFQEEFYRNGKGIVADLWSTNYSEMRNILLGMPSLAEQTRIAEFLDRETAKIDELVAEQRRLMELLKAKRQAVISHAVTQGLSPHAPMKPSGIGWLGDVPAHWVVTPLKWLTDQDRPIMYGIVLPGPDVGEGIPILKGGNVKPSRMNLESMARTTPEIEAPYARARLKEGDLAYSIRGTIGDCEPVPAALSGANITQDVARIAVADGNSARWVRWAMLASAVRDDLACGSLGAAVRGINIFDLKRAMIPTPPRNEQDGIAAFLDTETAKLEQLTAEAQRAIDLLQERRTSLISAAVTGQIDVRELKSA